MKKIENRSICARCGGRCCRHGGCNYLPQDFPNMKFNTLKQWLDKGEIAINVCLVQEMLTLRGRPNMVVTPIATLKAREINKGIVDLFGKSSACAQLTPEGCKYSLEERPSEGALLVPNIDGYCTNARIADETLGAWRSYQKVLKQLVQHYAKRSFAEELDAQILAAERSLRNEMLLYADVSKMPSKAQVLLDAIRIARSLDAFPFSRA